MGNEELHPWEYLAKKMFWSRLNFVYNMRVLDFGSGSGVTADHLAVDNQVTAVEPSLEMINSRKPLNKYVQLTGGIEKLRDMKDDSFDVIICHNVLEYVEERQQVINEFHRLLKNKGKLSIVKHNRPGRVMQMVVLLNNFQHAKELMEGENGKTQQPYGDIHYYDDGDINNWCKGFSVDEITGARTFWDLQQNQDIQKDLEWQKNMLEMELMVSNVEEYKNIACFHHIIFTNNK